MLKKSVKKYISDDRNFYSHVLTILLPIIVQNTVTNIIGLADNIMVGSIGTLSMSVVAIVNQLLFIFYLCIFGGVAGAGIFSTQYAGAGNYKGVRECFRFKIYIALSMYILAMVIFTLFSEDLISLYLAADTGANDAAQAMHQGKKYLGIMLIGLLPFTVSQIYGSTLREAGETKLPMLASVTAIIINLFLNYVLIYGNKGLPFLPFEPMGVAGAAIATVISRIVEAMVIVITVHKKKERYKFADKAYMSLKIPKELLIKICRKGSPLIINEFMWSLGIAALMQCYSVRGLDVVAATNIAYTVNNIFNVVFISMGNALAVVVGQYLGANKRDMAKYAVHRLRSMAVLSCVVMGGVLLLAAPYIPRLYNTSAYVRSTASGLLRIIALTMPLFAFSHCCYYALRAGGRSFTTLLFDSLYIWCFALPLASFLAIGTELTIVTLYALVQLSEIIKCVIGYILVKKGIWIKKVVG